MNIQGIKAIYRQEMRRFFRTIWQSILAPVITTSLYFVIFGSAIGSRIDKIEGISYGAFIVPGMLMMSLLTQSLSSASFGIYLEKFSGTIYEILSAPLSSFEILLGFMGAAITKSTLISIIIFITASFFVDFHVDHPAMMISFLLLTGISFSLFGFIIGLWADNFEKLQIIPLLLITPLTFLGGSFYSINMLPDFWQKISYLNPVLYLISGFRWSFFEISDVSITISLLAVAFFLVLCVTIVWLIFKTGKWLKN